MTEFRDWSVTASANTGASANGFFMENMQYSEVNDAAREFQAILARDRMDKNGTLVAGGSTSSYVLSISANIGSYRDGDYFRFRAPVKNAGATTLQIASLSARPVVKTDLTALVDGDIVAGGIYEVFYNSSSANFQVSNPGIAVSAPPYYARTAAEIAASVTPTNYEYEPGNVLRYGTNTTPGTTDMTAAIQAAADYCESSGDKMTGPPGEYLVSDTITINCECDLGLMTLVADGETVSPVILTGLTTGTSDDALAQHTRVMPTVINSAKTTTGWVDFDTSVGIDIANCYECRITIPEVYGFGIGVDVGGYTVGCSYNEFHLGRLVNNKINLRVGQKGVNGWANENNYYGGRFAFTSDEGTEISGTRHIQLRRVDSAVNNAPNNNVFLKPSIEGDGPEYHIDLEGSFNTFINPRCEVTGGARIRLYSLTANASSSNIFIGGYKTENPVFTRAGEASPYNKWIGGRSNDALEYTSGGISIVNASGSTVAYPHIQGFPAGQYMLEKTAASTEWIYRLYGGGFAVKATGDNPANPRMQIDSFGRINLGLGAAPPAVVWRIGSGSPEGSVTGAPGSMYLNTSGGAGTTLYVKESGTGNTGWVAK